MKAHWLDRQKGKRMEEKESFLQADQRPPLDPRLSPDDFRSFYWLKEELVAFCRAFGLPSTGSKEQISANIELFLATGTIKQEKTRAASQEAVRKPEQGSPPQEPLSVHTIITTAYRSDQAHRAFFRSLIGQEFHFTVHFMNFMKENIGKTYQDAIDEWYRERERKKDRTSRSPIAPQFEYNQYIRAYFEHNPGKTLQDAIASWNRKKKRRGSTTYSPADEKDQSE